MAVEDPACTMMSERFDPGALARRKYPEPTMVAAPAPRLPTTSGCGGTGKGTQYQLDPALTPDEPNCMRVHPKHQPPITEYWPVEEPFPRDGSAVVALSLGVHPVTGAQGPMERRRCWRSLTVSRLNIRSPGRQLRRRG